MRAIGRIKRAFRWAVSEELCPPAVLQGLLSVTGLRRGRSQARETQPIAPVDERTVAATLPYLPPVVRDMVELQRLVGCRPGELCSLRPCEVKRSGQVWICAPASHKTEHHGRDRLIFIGPRAQQIIEPYLAHDAEVYCFSPADSQRSGFAICVCGGRARCSRRSETAARPVPKSNPGCSTRRTRTAARSSEPAFGHSHHLPSSTTKSKPTGVSAIAGRLTSFVMRQRPRSGNGSGWRQPRSFWATAGPTSRSCMRPETTGLRRIS